MNRSDFQAALRSELRRISLATRRTWSESDLFVWWMQTREADPSLVWDAGRVEPWQYVRRMCRNLIGERRSRLDGG
jgi:hypothetical protein